MFDFNLGRKIGSSRFRRSRMEDGSRRGSGPEDFAIPAASWEARKARSSSSLLPPSRLLDSPSSPSAPAPTPISDPIPREPDRQSSDRPGLEVKIGDLRSLLGAGGRDGGIKALRPPFLSPPSPVAPLLATSPSRLPLTPPPPMSGLVLDKIGSAWDIVKSFAPDGDNGGFSGGRVRSFDSNDEDDHDYDGEVEAAEVLGGDAEGEEVGSSSFSWVVLDDSSSTTTEGVLVGCSPLHEAPAIVESGEGSMYAAAHPNGKFRRSIRAWMRGGLLGSGSFGTVYEGISDDGFFFAIKEVFLDQGNNAKQCILQLEQEITLLSQFEHENIVQYYGTDKEETKLFIFLELVTQGSLASLYQKYHLQNSQVSAYTRQILSGLTYLHERNVVHRDIKCANILVHVNGSVKLADFGLAKEISKFNVLKSCKGSVYWMAPEVVKPKNPYGSSADIWSLGCTVLEMLTRQIPYPDLEWTQALFRIGRGEKPPIPSSLSRDARDFISQCVRVNPDDRPSAAKLLEHPFVSI